MNDKTTSQLHETGKRKKDRDREVSNVLIALDKNAQQEQEQTATANGLLKKHKDTAATSKNDSNSDHKGLGQQKRLHQQDCTGEAILKSIKTKTNKTNDCDNHEPHCGAFLLFVKTEQAQERRKLKKKKTTEKKDEK